MIKTIILVFIIFFLSLLNINEYFVSNYTKIMNYDLNKLEFQFVIKIMNLHQRMIILTLRIQNLLINIIILYL